MFRLKLLRNEGQTWVAILSFLVCFDLLDTLHNYIALVGDNRPDALTQVLYQGTLFWLPYFLFTPAVVEMVQRFPLQVRRVRNILLHGVAGMAFAYVHNLFLIFVSSRPGETHLHNFVRRVKNDFALDYVLYWGIVGIACLFVHFAELKRRELAEVQLAASLTQAHLEALQGKLNPHFFFNTLQGISTLALAGDCDAVVKSLGCLSDLIRVSFDKRRPPKVSLTAELEFVDRYLSIQQMLIGDRLQIRRYIDAAACNALVPAMVLQPLLENAILHGIGAKPGSGIVTLRVVRDNEVLCLEVSDNGPGFHSAALPGNGVGLSAAQARLELLYGSDHNIALGRSAEGGASVTLRVPFEVCVVEAAHAVL